MSLNQPIRGLEKAKSIPQGTVYVASMGDGSGTMAVTQEVLTKAVGEELKIGDPKELQTENKESLVKAINEVKRSGGGGASVDVLDTQEEVEANTEAGKAAGALAMKGMFSKLKGFEPVINETTGQITGYKTTIGGADTVFPFSKTSCEPIGTFTASTNAQEFDVKSVCPDYESLTAQNFMLAVSNVTINTNSGGGSSGNGSISGSIMPTLTYKANTGVLTLSATSIRKNCSTSSYLYTTLNFSGKIFRI